MKGGVDKLAPSVYFVTQKQLLAHDTSDTDADIADAIFRAFAKLLLKRWEDLIRIY